MTFKEKLAREHPDNIIDAHLGGCRGCPNDYGYENTRYCKQHAGKEERCTKCWSREIPEPALDKYWQLLAGEYDTAKAKVANLRRDRDAIDNQISGLEHERDTLYILLQEYDRQNGRNQNNDG